MNFSQTRQWQFLKHAGIDVPVICGPMYPCSNPELVAAVSQAGGLGVVQPISLTYVHGYDFREGLRYIKRLTKKPIGMNALIEQSSQRYKEKMAHWIDIALDEGVRFFITSLGKPDWVVKRVHALGGVVYHDVTALKWAEKGLAAGVDGLIAVNNRAGGHAGDYSPASLMESLAGIDVPIVCAGGVSQPSELIDMLSLGFAGVQMGTRFIATDECQVSDDYKQAIVQASEEDIVMSLKVTGVPVSVINTDYVKKVGVNAGPFARWLLKGHKTKHLMRMIYTLNALWQLKYASQQKNSRQQYLQAGKSVQGIAHVASVASIMNEFSQVLYRVDGDSAERS